MQFRFLFFIKNWIAQKGWGHFCNNHWEWNWLAKYMVLMVDRFYLENVLTFNRITKSFFGLFSWKRSYAAECYKQMIPRNHSSHLQDDNTCNSARPDFFSSKKLSLIAPKMNVLHSEHLNPWELVIKRLSLPIFKKI